MTNHFSRLEPLEMSLAGSLYQVVFSTSLTGSQITYLQIKTGANPPLITLYELETGTEPVKMTMLETPTVTDGTSAITPVNLNRTKNTTPTTVFYTNPTSISGGTTIDITLVTSGKSGGASGENHGAWKYKPNTSYVWKLEQLTNQATVITTRIVFSEVYGGF